MKRKRAITIAVTLQMRFIVVEVKEKGRPRGKIKEREKMGGSLLRKGKEPSLCPEKALC
jgi:hypothetical protein